MPTKRRPTKREVADTEIERITGMLRTQLTQARGQPIYVPPTIHSPDGRTITPTRMLLERIGAEPVEPLNYWQLPE